MLPGELHQRIERGDIAPVYLFLGEAAFLMEEAWDHLVRACFSKTARRFKGERFLAKECPASDVIEKLSTVPMFGSRRLILVSGVEAWNKDQRNALTSYLKAPSPHGCLVLRAAQSKGIESLESCVASVGAVVHFKTPAEKDAPRWLRERAQYHGKQLSPDGAMFLVEQVGVDLFRLERELEKLAAYVGSRSRIELRDVQEVVGSQRFFTVFEMLRFLGRRKAHKALVSLRSLILLGEAPLAILGMLARQVRILWQIKEGIEGGLSTADLAKKLRLPPYVAKNLAGEASLFSHGNLMEIHQALREADLALKSTGTAPEKTLEGLVLKFCGKKPSGFSP